jgi:hypothetical protein
MCSPSLIGFKTELAALENLATGISLFGVEISGERLHDLNMTSQLFVDFPELANLSYVFAALPPRIVMAHEGDRRQDLEDLLTDQEYFQTVFMGLPKVQSMLQSLVELGRANESIASAAFTHPYHMRSFNRLYIIQRRTWHCKRDFTSFAQRHSRHLTKRKH